ncbi:MAG: nitroreductase family protein [Candidatus Methanofastidiosia archaeon]
MNLFEAIKKRRSIRSFEEKEVLDDDLKKILEMAIWAPSEGNLQPWKFYLVRDEDTKDRLTRAALNQRFLSQASVVIVVCADFHATSPYGERGINLYCLQSTAAAIQNMLLSAHALGLGACWVGAFQEEEIKEILKLPDHLRPIALIPIGYPAESPPPRRRKDLSDVTVWG